MGFKLNQKDIIYYTFHQQPSLKPEIDIEFIYSIQKNIFVYEKKENQLEANFEITLLLKNKDGDSKTFIWKEDIFAKTFEQTEKSEHLTFRKNLYLEPADYNVTIKIYDQISQKYRVINDKLIIKDYSIDDPYFSDIMFFKNDQYLVNQRAMSIKDSIYVSLYFRSERNHKVTISLTDMLINQEFYSYETEIKRSGVKFSMKKVLIDMRQLGEGDYKISFEIDNADQRVKKDRIFKVIWWDKPETLYSNRLSIRPFRVLLNDEESASFDEMSYDQQVAFFDDYWSARNRNKTFKYNPLKEEFFKRADYSAYNYGTKLTEGWNTDRGQVYMIYGKPQKVDKQFLQSGEYHIWIYNSFRKVFLKDQYSNDFSEVVESNEVN